VRLESIQTGQARTVGLPGADDFLEREWTSAIWKEPVEGRVWAGQEGLSGDVQVNRTHHGGSERALLLYSAAHYPRWRSEWGRRDLTHGGFGENLTVSGWDEWSVCVGDRFRVGDVEIEISGPRQPCQTLVRRHRRSDLIKEVQATGRSGWYARVLTEGWLERGLSIELADRPYPQWTIARAAVVARERKSSPEEANQLAGCPALLADWRAKLRR
jgi:MOSC domain-containing protein YiiM